MATEGRQLVLAVNVGTEAVPNYQILASQRDLTVNETADRIDVSDKDSAIKKYLQGSIDQSIETGTWLVSSDICYNTLRTRFITQQSVTIGLFEYGNLVESARVFITNLTRRAPTSGGIEASISLAVDGGFVAA